MTRAEEFLGSVTTPHIYLAIIGREPDNSMWANPAMVSSLPSEQGKGQSTFPPIPTMYGYHCPDHGLRPTLPHDWALWQPHQQRCGHSQHLAPAVTMQEGANNCECAL